MKLLGPNTLVQAALPDMLRYTPQSFYQRNLRILEESAKLCYSGLVDVPGLHPVMPAASMYMMVCVLSADISRVQRSTRSATS